LASESDSSATTIPVQVTIKKIELNGNFTLLVLRRCMQLHTKIAMAISAVKVKNGNIVYPVDKR
jgi:hypothetical protein